MMATNTLLKMAVLAETLVLSAPLMAQPVTKAHVAEIIRRVENGVDEFRNYLERRGENARTARESAPEQGKRARRGAATETQKATANAKKDELDEALGELNQSTNRLRRKFDAVDAWIETKVQVERVVDDGRRINQVVARGTYGAEAARLWAALRTQINELARTYNVPPLGV